MNKNMILSIGNDEGLLNSIEKNHSNGKYIKLEENIKYDFKDFKAAIFFDTAKKTYNYEEFLGLAVKYSIPLLYINLDKLEVNIGPWFIPTHPGCISCMEERRNRSKNYMSIQKNLNNNYTINKFIKNNIILFIIRELNFITQSKIPSAYNFVYSFSLKTSNITANPFLPAPHCKYCSQIQQDNINSSILKLHHREILNQESFRQDNPQLTLNNLKNIVCNPKFGAINNVNFFDGDIIPTITSRTNNDVFIGRQNNVYECELTSYLEYLERDAARYPIAKRTTIINSYKNLEKDAVDPQVFGLSKNPSIGEGYHEYKDIPWVWAYSFNKEMPILIPEQIAYFSNEITSPDDERFVIESSNGCSLGHTLEEAILHGLFEVLERDAFLLMWHGQYRAKAIDLDTINNQDIKFIKKRMNSLGYDLYLFNTTTEFNIPSFAAIAVNKLNEAPRFFVAGGCHLIPEKAMLDSLLELSAHAQIAKTISINKQERIEELNLNPSLISSLEDHYLYYYDPSNFHVIDFLLDDIQYEGSEYLNKEAYRSSMDLKLDLMNIVSRLKKENYDVLVVNQTPSYLKSFKLTACKVIVPGLLQLGVGINGDRATQQERLRKKSTCINENIHPFP